MKLSRTIAGFILFLFILLSFSHPLGAEEPIQDKFYPKNEKIKNFSEYLEAGETDYLLPLAEALPESSLLEGKLEKNCYLAWIYFYQGKYQLAAENRPSEYFQKMAEFAQGFKTAESGHFKIFTKDRDVILNDYALEAMEKVYDKIGQLFNYFPKDKIRVEIYSTSEEFNLASTLSKRDLEVSGAIGICKFNRIMLLSPEALAFGFRWQDALAHEYVHLLIQRLSRGNCPLWLHEGIAKYSEIIWRGGEAGYLPPSHQNLLAEAVKNNSLITFQQMHPSLVKLNSQEEVSLAFAEVCWAIKFLVNKSGEKILPKLLINLSKYPNPQTAFKKTLALSMNKFEEQWRKNLAEIQWSIKPGAILEKIRLKGSAGDEIEEFVEQSLGDYLRLGDRFRQRRAFSTAQEEYAKAEAIEPNNPVILNKLAKLLLDLGDPAKAEKKFKQAIQNNPNYGPVYTNYADMLFRQKRYSEALTNYQESNQFNPFNPLIHKMMGIIYLQQNDQEKARQEWQIVRTLLPEDRELSNWLKKIE